MTAVQDLESLGSRRAHIYLDLFLISFLILFFELACIRWFGSMVTHLTFFTNILLLATFLGMSAGCLTASNRQDHTRSVIPLLLIAVIACGVVNVSRITSDAGQGLLGGCISEPNSPRKVSAIAYTYRSFSGFLLLVDRTGVCRPRTGDGGRSMKRRIVWLHISAKLAPP